jgi:hypothetical protein
MPQYDTKLSPLFLLMMTRLLMITEQRNCAPPNRHRLRTRHSRWFALTSCACHGTVLIAARLALFTRLANCCVLACFGSVTSATEHIVPTKALPTRADF